MPVVCYKAYWLYFYWHWIVSVACVYVQVTSLLCWTFLSCLSPGTWSTLSAMWLWYHGKCMFAAQGFQVVFLFFDFFDVHVTQWPHRHGSKNEIPAGFRKRELYVMLYWTRGEALLHPPPSPLFTCMFVNVSVPQQKLRGWPNVGWVRGMCNCFPTLDHIVMHKNAVLPITPASGLRLWGISVMRITMPIFFPTRIVLVLMLFSCFSIQHAKLRCLLEVFALWVFHYDYKVYYRWK